MAQRYNLDNLEALFKDYLVSKGSSKITIKSYLSDIRGYLTWFEATQARDTDVMDMFRSSREAYVDVFVQRSTKPMIEHYIEILKSDSVPVRSINRKLSSIRNFYAFCVQRSIVEEDPTVGITNISEEQPTPKFETVLVEGSEDQVSGAQDVEEPKQYQASQEDLLKERIYSYVRHNVFSSEYRGYKEEIDHFFTFLDSR